MPNLSHLARLAKVIQGKQVFKTKYARDMLDKAIKDCGIEDLTKSDEKNETKAVRERLQSNIDSVRRSASDTDKKLKSALDKIAALTDKNESQAEEIASLTARLAVAESKAMRAEKRVITGEQQQRNSLKRVF